MVSPLFLATLPFSDTAFPAWIKLLEVAVILAGSEPTSDSVSANAEISPAARRGRYFFFCSGVPNILSGCGTPIDWCADSRTPSAAHGAPTIEMAWL